MLTALSKGQIGAKSWVTHGGEIVVCMVLCHLACSVVGSKLFVLHQ